MPGRVGTALDLIEWRMLDSEGTVLGRGHMLVETEPDGPTRFVEIYQPDLDDPRAHALVLADGVVEGMMFSWEEDASFCQRPNGRIDAIRGVYFKMAQSVPARKGATATLDWERGKELFTMKKG